MGGQADDAKEKVGQVAEVAQQYLPLNLAGDKVKHLRIPGMRPDGALDEDVSADGTRAGVGKGLNAIRKKLQDESAADDYYVEDVDNDYTQVSTQWPDQSNDNSKELSSQPIALSVVSTAAAFTVALALLFLLLVWRGRYRKGSPRDVRATEVTVPLQDFGGIANTGIDAYEPL